MPISGADPNVDAVAMFLYLQWHEHQLQAQLGQTHTGIFVCQPATDFMQKNVRKSMQQQSEHVCFELSTAESCAVSFFYVFDPQLHAGALAINTFVHLSWSQVFYISHNVANIDTFVVKVYPGNNAPFPGPCFCAVIELRENADSARIHEMLRLSPLFGICDRANKFDGL